MVEKIKGIAAGHGCMVCILSQKAVSDSLFISNIQLMCETARNNRVLVYYPVEQLGDDQNIRLFDSQAYQVKRTGSAAEDVSGVIQRINQIIHPPARDIFQLLSRIISRKALTGLLIAVAVLGVIASVFLNLVKKRRLRRCANLHAGVDIHAFQRSKPEQGIDGGCPHQFPITNRMATRRLKHLFISNLAIFYAG